MIVAGLDVGAFTVLVGQDDAALKRVSWQAPGNVWKVAHGIPPETLADIKRNTGGVILTDLCDSVHPTRIPALMASLRAAGVPIVAATHNPYVLDCCDPSEVIVLHDGHAARLSEHPIARMGALSAGQLWTLDDEATWVPAAARKRTEGAGR